MPSNQPTSRARDSRFLSGVGRTSLLTFFLAASAAAFAQSYSVTYTFPGGSNGAFPYGTVSKDKKGEVFGTTYKTDGANGGSGFGVVYQVTSGVQTVLHTFTGPPNDGANPKGGLIHSDSILYGTATNGGNSTNCTGGCGIVYTVTFGGRETILHNFTGGLDGANPLGTVILDSSNNIYGTTQYGGSTECPQGCGIIFEVTSAGKEIVAYRFRGSDGKFPQAGLLGSGSVAYGTTSEGGAYSNGTVFKINTSAQLTTVYSFQGGNDGAMPIGPVVQDASGNLYGTTYNGGGSTACSGGCGTLFKIDTTGKETVLYSFTGGADGANPRGSLAMDLQGNLFGVTNAGGVGTPGLGVIFGFSTAGKQSVLHAFAGGTDGANPYGGLVRDASDYLYGATVYGGDLSCGTRGCGVTFTAHP